MAGSKFQELMNSFKGGNVPWGEGGPIMRGGPAPQRTPEELAEWRRKEEQRIADRRANDPEYDAYLTKKEEKDNFYANRRSSPTDRFNSLKQEQQGPNAGVAGSNMQNYGFSNGGGSAIPSSYLRGSTNSMNTTGYTNSQTGNTNQTQGGDAPINFPGMFNLQGIMDGFYGYRPAADDELGNAMKMSFASNMIQSGFDAMLAQQMAQYQAGLGQQNMKVAADLEYRNNSEMMGKEFEYGMASMGAQFDYQNQFANAQYDRDIGMLGAQGVDKRKTDSNLANEQRLNAIVQGEQQRLNTELQGGFDVDRANIAADATKYGAKTTAEASKDVATTQAGASMYGAKEAADANRFTASAQERASKYSSDAEKYGADAQERASMYGADKTNDASRYGAEQSRAGAENVATTQAGAQVASAKLSKEASTYGADQTRIASMYGADRSLEGVKDTNVTSTRNIRATGEEQRTSAAQANKFTIDKENRAQARSRAGARRY